MTTGIWDAIVGWLSSAPMCSYFGKPWLTGLHLIGNLLVFTAYMAIPAAISIVLKRKGIPFGALGMMFALFIFLCGFGHALSLISMWTTDEVYDWVETSNDLLTGIVSVITAVYAFKLIPVIIHTSTPAETIAMKKTIDQYRDEFSLKALGKPWPKD